MEKENLYLNCSFFNTSWENGLMDHQNDPFESALSSMVCSPTASNAANSGGCNFNGQHIVIKELIGRLGGICNSGEISAANGGGGADASCYSTPLNSPRRINSLGVEKQRIRESLPEIRGGGFSCFTNNSLVTDPGPDRGKIYECPTFAPQQQALNAAPGDSMENSSLSELIPANPRKRKAPAKGRGKETSAIPPAKQVNAPSESYAKRCKSEENRSYSEKGDAIKVKPGVNHKQQKEDSKAPEPPKDYIHVRARRGQATDAHSLAERVRREKISERMRILQDLVPGCNKIAGKAVMLDEIINYVQSLQRQVEFLSMKLATVTPRMDYNMETAVVKDMCQARGLFNHYANPSESYCIHSQTNLHGAMPISNNHRKHSPPMEIYSETTSRVSMFLEDDLHTVVHMGFREDESQEFPGVLKPTQMKIEH